MLVNPKSQTFWLERLNISGILFLVLSKGIAQYKVFYDEHKATPQALRFAAILTILLPIKFYPANLCLNQKDENGLALEYYRADNLCNIVDAFVKKQLSSAPAWLQNMIKCFISSQVMDRITFMTLVLHRIRGADLQEHSVYISGHYLNFLLRDYFNGQIKIKSLLSIAAALRLLATPFLLIVRTGLQQLLKPGVSGNIRENPAVPAVWIELTPKSAVWDRLRAYIATHSSGRTYDIVYYLDSNDTFPVPETTEELENQGFGWIDTRNMLHARLYPRDYFRLMAGLLDHLRRRPFWLAWFLFQFEVRRTLYLSQYKRFKVRLLFQHQEQSWFQEAQKQAVEAAGGIMAGLHWSNYLNTRYPDLLTCQHVMLVWGMAHREFLETKGNACSHILPCGLWLTGSEAKPEDVLPPQRNNFTIAIFDSSVGYLVHQSAENLSKFYLEILDILKVNSSLSGIIKSKSSYLADLRQLPSGEEIVSKIEMLEKQGRLSFLDWTKYSPLDAAEAADLSVCFGLNSAGIIVGLLGLKAVHWDCTGWLKYPIYQDEGQKVVFGTLSEVRQAVLQAAAGDQTVGDFHRWRQWINHFDDCAGRERILHFINLHMSDSEGDITKLNSTVRRYLAHLAEPHLVSWTAGTSTAKNYK